ncbi:MAG: hypothetical protein K0B37_04260 [Bacteroidales bacterium]|nr:hypothetical protein [Bacteroidales bacterium]
MPGRKKQRNNDFGAIHIFLGLLIGFFLGSTVVYWQFNRQNDRIIQETVEKVLAIFSDNSSGSGLAIASEESDEESAPDEVNPEINNQLQGSALSFEGTPSNLPGITERETYSLARDKLIHSRVVTVSVPQLPKSESERILDSVLGNTSNNSDEQVFYVEFWESPLNSVGYKMSKTRIVFYGIKIFEMADIYHNQGTFYLSYLNDFYPLEFTNTFKPLIPQNNPVSFHDIRGI